MNTSPSPTEATPAAATYDPLEHFVEWFMKNHGPIPFSLMSGVRRVGQFTGLTLGRSGQFQAQLWICDPMSEIPDHSHPNIDTIQVYVTGDLALRLNGKPAMEGAVTELPDGRCSHNSRWVRVRPNDTHGATIGKLGAAFINFQHWTSGEPTSAELDWKGEPLSEDHENLLNSRAVA